MGARRPVPTRGPRPPAGRSPPSPSTTPSPNASSMPSTPTRSPSLWLPPTRSLIAESATHGPRSWPWNEPATKPHAPNGPSTPANRRTGWWPAASKRAGSSGSPSSPKPTRPSPPSAPPCPRCPHEPSSKRSPPTCQPCGTRPPPRPGTANGSCAPSSPMSRCSPSLTSPRPASGSAGTPAPPTSSWSPGARTSPNIDALTPRPSISPAVFPTSPTTTLPNGSTPPATSPVPAGRSTTTRSPRCATTTRSRNRGFSMTARSPSPRSPAGSASATAPSSTGSPEAGFPPGAASTTSGASRSALRSKPPPATMSLNQRTSTSPTPPTRKPTRSSPSQRSPRCSASARTSSTTGSNAVTSSPGEVPAVACSSVSDPTSKRCAALGSPRRCASSPSPNPKPHGPRPRRQYEAIVPTTADRVVQASLKLVLEPIFEADFKPASYGFRPKRRAQDAIAEIHQFTSRGYEWVLEGDITACFDAPLHCPFRCWCVLEEAGIGRIHLDSQAFSASGADVDGFELAALDTLQHGLAGHAESAGGLEHRQPAGRRVVDEAGPQLVGHADTPRGAGGELFAGDEPIVEPAVHGGSSDAEDLGRVGDGDELAVGLLGRSLVTRDLPVMPQGLDDGGGEPLAGGAAPTLAVQDAGDGGVGVVDGEPAQQLDGVLVGAGGGLVGAAQLDEQLGPLVLLVYVDADVLEQRAQQLLAVPVAGGGRGPHPPDVRAERGQRGAFVVGGRRGPRRLPPCQFGFGVGQRGELGFPVGLQAAGHQAVVRVDGQVAPLGSDGLVAGSFDLASPLAEGGVVVSFDHLGGSEGGGHAGGSEGGEGGRGDGPVDLHAAHAQAVHAAAVDEGAVGAVIARCRVGALVVDSEAPAASPAGGQPLQQGGSFPQRAAAGLMGSRGGVGADAGLVGLVGRPVDVAGMLVHDQHLPVRPAQDTGSGPHAAVVIDAAFSAGAAIDIGASVGRVREHPVDRRVGRRDPGELGVAGALHGHHESLAEQPQPHRARRAQFGEAFEDGGDHAAHGLVGVQQDLAVFVAPHQPDGQAPAQLASCGLVADAAFQAGAQHVQLGLAHRALETQHQPVVEAGRVVDAIGVGDQRVGDTGQVQQPIPVGVGAGQPRHLQAEHDPYTTKGDVGGDSSEARACGAGRARDAKVLVDHLDGSARPAQLDGSFHERVLAVRGPRLAFGLAGCGLAHVDHRGPPEVGGADLGVPGHRPRVVGRISHRRVPPRVLVRRAVPSAGRAPRPRRSARRERGAPTRAAVPRSARPVAAVAACGTSSVGSSASSNRCASARWMRPSATARA